MVLITDLSLVIAFRVLSYDSSFINNKFVMKNKIARDCVVDFLFSFAIVVYLLCIASLRSIMNFPKSMLLCWS